MPGVLLTGEQDGGRWTRNRHPHSTVVSESGRAALVEAARVEPDPCPSTNRVMAHDFRHKTLIPRKGAVGPGSA